MNDYTIGGTGYVLVEVEDTHNDKSGILNKDGQEIVLDTSYDPIRYAKYSGKVIQLPSNLGGKPVTQDPIGVPGYGAIRGVREEEDHHPAIYSIGGVLKYKLMYDIEPEVRIGDRIWFKPRVLNNPINKIDEIKTPDGKKKFIYRVEYDLIICAVRHYDISMFDGATLIGTEHGMDAQAFANQWAQYRPEPLPEFKNMIVDVTQGKDFEKVTAKEIVMIGAWVLLKPIMEDWGSIFKKTYYPHKDKRGRPVEKPQDQWIQIKTEPAKEKMRGIVRFYGSPLKGEVCELEPMAKVWIRKVASDWILEIEGHRYIVCRQNQIIAEELE